ncbi:MAG: cysteine dioxygenase family protein [Candidatus Eremiobacteraeota bacterium]|nr:cysteine dioxygenase family protein [Candidatus Eremiobacteraeota bacterium]
MTLVIKTGHFSYAEFFVLSTLIADFRARAPLAREASEMAALLGATAAEMHTLPSLPRRSGGYTRTCAYQDSTFELLLLNWAAGAESAIHDHGDQHCWMLVLSGRLEVCDFDRLDSGESAGYAHVEPGPRRLLAAGEMDLRSGRFDLHSVRSADRSPAVTLHVYSGPLREFLTYDPSARRCTSVVSVYDEVLSSAKLVRG